MMKVDLSIFHVQSRVFSATSGQRVMPVAFRPASQTKPHVYLDNRDDRHLER
jgi:hypothetical protein